MRPERCCWTCGRGAGRTRSWTRSRYLAHGCRMSMKGPRSPPSSVMRWPTTSAFHAACRSRPAAATTRPPQSASAWSGASHLELHRHERGAVRAPRRFTPDPSGRVHAFCHAVPGAYHLMAVTLSAGGSLNWWRERFAGRADFEPLVAEAADVEPGAEGLLFLPYLTGERSPHLDPRASGAFVGLTARHGRAQLTRAIMEGVVLSMRDGLEVMRALGTAVDEVRATGGGARSPLWLQLQADVYGCPIRRTGVDEGPAYGAALLAGVASGVFTDIEAATLSVRVRESITEPDPQSARRYDELYATFTSLYPTLRDAMHALARR